MGTDDLFKKRRQDRKQRNFEYKEPRANSFLIVTEGECTGPLYFQGMKRLIKEKMGGIIDVIDIPVIDICGKGCSTRKLIQETDRIVKKAKIIYQNIWVVFDKDDFEDFDEAIEEGKQKGYKTAWSNQSFEYWIYLHFYYSDSALHRDEWAEKLDKLFKEYSLGQGKYRKNYKDIYHILNSFGGVAAAVQNAKRRMSSFDENAFRPSEYDPGTMVYKLVEELRQYIDE